MRTAYRFKDLPRTYGELLEILPPRPIHTEAQYEEAREMVEVLAGHKLSRDQEDYLDAIGTFMEVYEEEHHPMRDVSGLTLLKHLMQEHGMTASDLGRLLGDRSVGWKVLNNERELSKNHIKALADHFGLSSAAFM